MTSYTFVSCIDSRVENLTKFYGRFQLGPFAPGQALTVANALRRALLSQLSGISITLLEIQGASNEYEVLKGVRESVLDILLNLKQIVLTSDFENMNPQVGFLAVKGPGVVRSGDLKLPAFIYAVDPNQYIATLSTNGRLNCKFLICSGKNSITYSPSDYNRPLCL
jgi:DNA-directed RNA polymerase subunit alpha